MRYKCLIIEDEPLAQTVIQTYLAMYPQLELVNTCNNAVEAFQIITQQKIDLLFLDIHLPGINGLHFIQNLKHPPGVIFTTAFAEYAAASYELEAVDYLVKPITAERFDKSIKKLLRIQHKEKEAPATEIFIKVNGQLVKVPLHDIVYIEARKDYLRVHLPKGYHITHMTVKAMEELLPPTLFIRIHRSYIVARKKLSRIAPTHVELEAATLPIGKKFKEAVLKEAAKW